MTKQRHDDGRIVVACPDARPPAYQAAIGLSRAGLLQHFVTSFHYDPTARRMRLARRIFASRWSALERVLLRRYCPGIPADRVRSVASVDVLLRIEALAARGSKALKLKPALARARTVWFDGRLARVVKQARPDAVMVFSDVGSGITLPLCRSLGIPTVLSMVHGEVGEELEVLDQEMALSPDFFPIYLGDGVFDRAELSWLHQRRLRDVALADLILVPSEHIAGRLGERGIPRSKLRVVPYAADTTRFQPREKQPTPASCTFLFAGGITQRKGIKYLLEAWRQVRRPGWKLQLLGPLPRNSQALDAHLQDVELLGRVGHSEVPSYMASADVFVFPSLFEGSAVVTYEALACGLPMIVSPAAGSVVRHGIEGFLVPPRDVQALACSMRQLGESPELRLRMAEAARARALEFNWDRYQRIVIEELVSLSRSSCVRVNPTRRVLIDAGTA